MSIKQAEFDYAWLGLAKNQLENLNNPLLGGNSEENPALNLIRIMRNPKYLGWTCKILFNLDLLPIHIAVLRQLHIYSFPMLIGSRGFAKSFLLAVYALLKSVLYPDMKIVVCGAAFRQSKIVFEYMDQIWRNAPIFRSICNGNSGPRRDVDRCMFRVNDSITTALPIGTGEKIRGMRANILLLDEFSSVNPEIYEVVIAGFAAVSQNPIQNVKEAAKRKAMKAAGVWTKELETTYASRKQNQSILSGTASYSFNHFAKYWERYKAIVESRGNQRKLQYLLGDDDLSSNLMKLNWRDFCIMRIPYEVIPEGFLDAKIVSRSKAVMHSGLYALEYGACFVKDSAGFFKRTLIESIVASDENVNKEHWVDYCQVPFDCKIKGGKDAQFVLAVDPAADADNLAIVVLEIFPEHQRLVYCWTTNRKDFQNRVKAGLVDTEDYFCFCVRKIRDLMHCFNIIRIGIDTQGGGHQIVEGLHDRDKMVHGELPLWEVIDEDKEKETDLQPGLHIIEKINFSNAIWTSQANNGLRSDMEHKVLLFPRFDSATLSLATTFDEYNLNKMKELIGEGKILGIFDTLEDVSLEIEELKNELSTIVMTQTGIVGRDRWDTPEVKMNDGKKGRLRKDRYSALVMANMLARQVYRVLPDPEYHSVGAIAQRKEERFGAFSGQLYTGPEWAKGLTGKNCYVVNRRK